MAFAPGQPSVLQHRTNDIAGEPAARLSSLGLLWVFPPTSERRVAPHPVPDFGRDTHTPTRPHAEHREAPVAKVDTKYAPQFAQRGALRSSISNPPAPRRQPSSSAARAAACGRGATAFHGGRWGTYIAIAVDSGYDRGARRRDARPTCADTRACGGHARELTRQRPAHARSLLLAPPSGKPLGGSVRRGAVCSSGTL